ncbi:serine/arginine repetitive matrix protein 1-like [Psammomys obesus]|uniref:serine/arginine repetitive matrix protein 1-like n=1 Tax=Psammomys obesus TaxID=48139 RepID=UPI002452C5A0|nr:serine/arginine repetitive matrix protein 1-like [Psammomys obesus]
MEAGEFSCRPARPPDVAETLPTRRRRLQPKAGLQASLRRPRPVRSPRLSDRRWEERGPSPRLGARRRERACAPAPRRLGARVPPPLRAAACGGAWGLPSSPGPLRGLRFGPALRIERAGERGRPSLFLAAGAGSARRRAGRSAGTRPASAAWRGARRAPARQEPAPTPEQSKLERLFPFPGKRGCAAACCRGAELALCSPPGTPAAGWACEEGPGAASFAKGLSEARPLRCRNESFRELSFIHCSRQTVRYFIGCFGILHHVPQSHLLPSPPMSSPPHPCDPYPPIKRKKKKRKERRKEGRKEGGKIQLVLPMYSVDQGCYFGVAEALGVVTEAFYVPASQLCICSHQYPCKSGFQ